MPGVHAFDNNVDQYEQWFMDHPLAYVSELHAVRELVPPKGNGMEVGVGTGRFAAPLGIRKGIEPSAAMAELAKKKGIEVVNSRVLPPSLYPTESHPAASPSLPMIDERLV